MAFSFARRGGVTMAGAFEIVMQERKALVDKIIGMMKQGDFFHNASEWDRAALRPQNPLSKVWYRGGNRMKLMAVVTERGYRDPRWATAKQLFGKGYHIKAGEHGTICEKWIFEKEKKTKDEYGNIVREVVQLDRPQVMYFRVFNGEQVEGFPEYVPSVRNEDRTQLGDMIDRIISTSECPVIEVAQDRAYYSPSQDRIVLPLRSMFKDEESFAKTAIHEMGHSTGHPDRLNRPLGGMFGSEEYAKEELRAEIGALFTEADLGISLKGEHYEDHSDYLRSWIGALQNDYNEFFRACADAEQIAKRLVGNYTKKYDLKMEVDEVPDMSKAVSCDLAAPMEEKSL